MTTKRWTVIGLALALLVIVAMVVAACGGTTTTTTTAAPATTTTAPAATTTTAVQSTTTSAAGSTTTAAATNTTISLPDLTGQTIEVAAVWTDGEETAFKQVAAAFTAATHCNVTFTSTGNDIATILGTRIAGGSPPDVAFVPQPGLMASLVKQNALQPIGDLVANEMAQWYAPSWNGRGHGQRDSVRLGVQAREQVDLLVQRRGPPESGRDGTDRHLGRPAERCRHRARLGRHPLLHRGRRRLDHHRLVREHLPADRGRRQLQQTGNPRDPLDRPDCDHAL